MTESLSNKVTNRDGEVVTASFFTLDWNLFIFFFSICLISHISNDEPYKSYISSNNDLLVFFH